MAPPEKYVKAIYFLAFLGVAAFAALEGVELRFGGMVNLCESDGCEGVVTHPKGPQQDLRINFKNGQMIPKLQPRHCCCYH